MLSYQQTGDQVNLSCRVDSVFPEPEVDLMWTRGREVNINSETDDFRSVKYQTKGWLGSGVWGTGVLFSIY